MMQARKLAVVGASLGLSGLALGQAPDLLTAFDSGGRAMGLGGAGAVNDSSTYSALDNPAGLAFVFAPTYSLGFRNLPDRQSAIFGNLANPDRQEIDNYGRTTFTHYGVAIPFAKGALGLSYTLGGYYLETTFAGNLTSNGDPVTGYLRSRKFQTDYFTGSYGFSQGPSNLGVGVVIAHQYSRDTERYTVTQGTGSNEVLSGASGSLYGVGLVAGIQRDYGSRLNIGASVRTPIELDGDADAEALLPRLPGKASLGFAGRIDRPGRQDFLIWSIQGDYWFGGDDGSAYPRDDFLSFGAGAEFNLVRGANRIPIRLGYASRPAGGAGFTSRDALTFGLGWRPADQPFFLDLSLAQPDKGKMDAALTISYRGRS